MKKHSINQEKSELRRKAEDLVDRKKLEDIPLLSRLDILKLIHELEVHKIELEMQNEELEKSRDDITEKYIELYEFAPTGYFSLSPEGEIIDLNIRGSQLLGKNRSDLKNSRFGLFVSEDTRQVFNLFIKKVIQNKARETCDLTLMPYEGAVKYVHLAGIFSANEQLCFVSVTDITEHRQALKTEKLESISLLAGGIAHDFNNLLSIVLGNLEYLNLTETGNPGITGHIADAKKAVDKAAVLVKQLMAYAGKAFYEITEFEVNSLITRNSELIRSVIGRHIHLETDLQDGMPLITGDEKEMEHVLMNLLINASESIGKEKGIIRISTGTAYFDEEILKNNLLPQKIYPGNYVFIKISDNGCGMDGSRISRVFEPFYTTKFTGRGMGMASVQGIVTSHSGGIFIDSALDQGTTITAILPTMGLSTRPEKNIVKRKRDETIKYRFKGTLIVAEDEVLLLKMNSEILELLGFKVLGASNGIEALELFKADPGIIDGLILDIVMPESGGIDTAKAVREIDKDIPIIFVSGYDPSDSLDSVSYNAFLDKPVPMDKLLEILKSVFKDLIV